MTTGRINQVAVVHDDARGRPATTKQPTIDRSERRTILGLQRRSGGGSGRGHRRSRRRSAGDRRTRSRGGRERRRRASHRRETVSVRTARMPPQPEGNKTRGAPSRRCRAPPRRDRFANLRLASRDPVAGSEYARPSSIVNRLYSVKRHSCSGRECTTCRRIPDASAPGHERSLGLATVTNRQREEGPKRRSAPSTAIESNALQRLPTITHFFASLLFALPHLTIRHHGSSVILL